MWYKDVKFLPETWINKKNVSYDEANLQTLVLFYKYALSFFTTRH